jgi:hypothetical protein
MKTKIKIYWYWLVDKYRPLYEYVDIPGMEHCIMNNLTPRRYDRSKQVPTS